MDRHHFTDPATVIDELHACLDAWDEADRLSPPLSEAGAAVFRLAVHEWVANLVQHATFRDAFEIVVEMEVQPDGVACAIEDTSAGFDFAAQIERQTAVLTAPAPSERGRGLLMLVSCTESLAFQPAAPGVRQRVAFRIAPPTEGDVFAPLFRPEDLGAEPGDGADAADRYSGDGLAGSSLPTHASPNTSP